MKKIYLKIAMISLAVVFPASIYFVNSLFF